MMTATATENHPELHVVTNDVAENAEIGEIETPTQPQKIWILCPWILCPEGDQPVQVEVVPDDPRVITEADLGLDAPRPDWLRAYTKTTVAKTMVQQGYASTEQDAQNDPCFEEYVDALMADTANFGGNSVRLWRERCSMISGHIKRLADEASELERKRVEERHKRREGLLKAARQMAAAEVSNITTQPETSVGKDAVRPIGTAPTPAKPTSMELAQAALKRSASFTPDAEKLGTLKTRLTAFPFISPEVTDNLALLLAYRWVFANTATATTAAGNNELLAKVEPVANVLTSAAFVRFGLPQAELKLVTNTPANPCSRAMRDEVERELRTVPEAQELMVHLKPCRPVAPTPRRLSDAQRSEDNTPRVRKPSGSKSKASARHARPEKVDCECCVMRHNELGEQECKQPGRREVDQVACKGCRRSGKPEVKAWVAEARKAQAEQARKRAQAEAERRAAEEAKRAEAGIAAGKAGKKGGKKK